MQANRFVAFIFATFSLRPTVADDFIKNCVYNFAGLNPKILGNAGPSLQVHNPAKKPILRAILEATRNMYGDAADNPLAYVQFSTHPVLKEPFGQLIEQGVKIVQFQRADPRLTRPFLSCFFDAKTNKTTLFMVFPKDFDLRRGLHELDHARLSLEKFASLRAEGVKGKAFYERYQAWLASTGTLSRLEKRAVGIDNRTMKAQYLAEGGSIRPSDQLAPVKQSPEDFEWNILYPHKTELTVQLHYKPQVATFAEKYASLHDPLDRANAWADFSTQYPEEGRAIQLSVDDILRKYLVMRGELFKRAQLVNTNDQRFLSDLQDITPLLGNAVDLAAPNFHPFIKQIIADRFPSVHDLLRSKLPKDFNPKLSGP